MIDTRKLKVFLTVADCESYTAAARKLSTVQSTISHAIHDLEEDLGCSLFQKIGKRMVLTDEAVSLLDYGKKIASLMEEAREAVNPTCHWGKRRFTIGASLSASLTFIPEVLRELNECFPKCTTSIVTGNAPEIMTGVRSGHLDIAISLEPEHEPQLDFKPVFCDEMCWVLSPLMPWTEKPDMNDVAFKSQRFITFCQDSYTCRLVESFFKKYRFTPQSLTYMGSMEAIKAFVKLGQGVSLMPAWVAKEEIDSGCLRALPTGSDDLKRRWGITHRKGQLLGDMEETFWRLCQASIHNKSIEGYPVKTFPIKIYEQPVAEI